MAGLNLLGHLPSHMKASKDSGCRMCSYPESSEKTTLIFFLQHLGFILPLLFPVQSFDDLLLPLLFFLFAFTMEDLFCRSNLGLSFFSASRVSSGRLDPLMVTCTSWHPEQVIMTPWLSVTSMSHCWTDWVSSRLTSPSFSISSFRLTLLVSTTVP